MVLGELQSLLADIYALEIGYDVYDFLITDEGLAARLDVHGRQSDEKLLILERPEGEAEVSLYLGASLLERLQRNAPTERLSEANLGDFWTAFEGLSHFTYYAFNATQNKAVTLLEMELQAEVDKFIAAALLLRDQGARSPGGLHRCLFETARFDERLSAAELDRYRVASRYAGKYCSRIAPRLDSGLGDADLRRELRSFYRLSQGEKIHRIESRTA
jgi:hypothetical protein